MMKKNKLYTVNKWNREAIGDAVEKAVPYPTENLFWGGGNVAKWDRLASQAYGANYGDEGFTLDDYMNHKNALGITRQDNPFSKGNIGNTAKVGAAAAGELGYNLISDGYRVEGTAGNIMSAAQKIKTGDPRIDLAKDFLIGVGQRAFGMKVNQEALNAANAGTSALNNFTSNAKSFDAIQGPQAVAAIDNPYSGGWFKKKDARERNEALKRARAEAVAFADRSVNNNIYNIAEDQLNDALANYSAFGGPIEQIYNDDMGAINYDFMDRYLTAKEAQNKQKNQMTNLFAGTPSTMFDLGGVLQNHGADWSTGLTHVNAGGTHEESPYDGVQMGVDPQGIPNLVEENETVYNDYVFSNRIMADDATKQLFHLPKKKDITYADISKKLEKEITERPNDPISKAGFNAQMQKLQEQQERQKAEMEAERAREAFEALSPEEKVAVMQQAQQQEQAAQEAAMQEQANMPVTQPEQAMMPVQGSPEEMAMQEQMAQQQAPVMAGYGGCINKFDKGGVLKLLNSLGYKTVADAEKAGWKPSDFGDFKEWTDINSDSKLSDAFKWTDEFSKRLTSPVQKAMLSLGWNPTATLLGRKWYEGDNGNRVGWTESVGKNALNAAEFEDYANRYKNTLGWAVQNGRIQAPTGNGTVSMADITRAMRESPDWKATDDWLYSDIANQAAYLGMARGLNPDNDTKFINRWSPYGSFTQREDGNWNYTLRDNLTDAEKKAFTDQFRRARTDNKVGVMYNNFTDPDTVTNRYVLDGNGNPVLLTDDDLSGYEEIGNYSWGDEANNTNRNAVIYRQKGAYGPDNLYGAPWAPGATRSGDAAPATGTVGTDTAKKGAATGNGEEFEVEPNYRAEWPRYAGLFSPAVGLGLMAAGVGKPDTSGIEAAANSAGNAYLADYKPIGNYLTYRPMDIWFEQNRMDANARATDRNILNTSGGNRGTAVAGMLANGYNSQIADGELYRKALEYNDALRERTETFNRGTNQFNADAYNRLSQFNADAINRNKQYNAQLAMQAAREKMDADAGWYNSLYGNIGGLFKGISDLGRENAQHNMIAEMAANGIFGTMSPKTHVGRKGKYLTWKKK